MGSSNPGEDSSTELPAIPGLRRWLPVLDRSEQAAIYNQMRNNARAGVDFYVMILLSSSIAYFGLLQNSVAVIIGAMLVAPLMSPMIAIAHSIVMGNLLMFRRPAVPAHHRQALQRLGAIRGLSLQTLPQIVFINVQDKDGGNYYYTLLHNSAHSNVTSLFREESNLVPEDDTLTVVRGFIGSYPGAFWQVDAADLEAWVDEVAALGDEGSYARLMDRYGVRRTAAQFWQHSDQVMTAQHRDNPVENGLLDYNRLQNR